MDGAVAAGERLAARHLDAPPPDPDPDGSLVGYAEVARVGDWSLRSALVRLAQPEPVRAGAVLELIRRCDGALRPHARLLERTTTWCDRAVTVDTVDSDPVRPCADGRATDVARLVRSSPADRDAVLGGYTGLVPLEDAEIDLVPLLVVALELDHLGDVLATWADAGPDDPPVHVVDEACRRAFDGLGALGVPRETGPPRRGRSG